MLYVVIGRKQEGEHIFVWSLFGGKPFLSFSRVSRFSVIHTYSFIKLSNCVQLYVYFKSLLLCCQVSVRLTSSVYSAGGTVKSTCFILAASSFSKAADTHTATVLKTRKPKDRLKYSLPANVYWDLVYGHNSCIKTRL